MVDWPWCAGNARVGRLMASSAGGLARLSIGRGEVSVRIGAVLRILGVGRPRARVTSAAVLALAALVGAVAPSDGGQAALAAPAGSGFTYQGSLELGGAPFDG